MLFKLPFINKNISKTSPLMKLRNLGFSWATLKEVWGWSLGLRLDGDNLGYSSPAKQASCMVRRRSMLKLVRQGRNNV
jgi:hypothetical protein